LFGSTALVAAACGLFSWPITPGTLKKNQNIVSAIAMLNAGRADAFAFFVEQRPVHHPGESDFPHSWRGSRNPQFV
jgi:hypothetical protein